MATCFQSAATLGTMNLLMSSSVGCESMLKWVDVSVESETRDHQFVHTYIAAGLTKNL